jgi:hypothetical protein
MVSLHAFVCALCTRGATWHCHVSLFLMSWCKQQHTVNIWEQQFERDPSRQGSAAMELEAALRSLAE